MQKIGVFDDAEELIPHLNWEGGSATTSCVDTPSMRPAMRSVMPHFKTLMPYRQDCVNQKNRKTRHRGSVWSEFFL